MILKSSEEFLREALTNNSFGVEETDIALRYGLDHAFAYLYRLQRSMVYYEEFFYTTRNIVERPDYGDLFMDTRERICVNFPAELILPVDRERYRNSKFYNQQISYDALSTEENKSLFQRLPILFIDDKLVRYFDVDIRDDYFTAHLPFGRYFLHTRHFDTPNWEYEFIDHSISLQIIKNSFFVDIATNVGMLRRNSYSGNGFDRLKMQYVQDLGVHIDTGKVGTWFAAIFFNDEVTGSQLQDVTTDFENNLSIHYDVETLERLQEFNGTVTIRFIFYKNLHSYTSYKSNGLDADNPVKVRELNGKPVSEACIIQEKERLPYRLPIPPENLMVFQSKIGEYNREKIIHRRHYPNLQVTLTYPNIYRFESDDVEVGDRFRVFYFYIPPYDLNYDYMYWYFYAWLTYKWKAYRLEEIINRVIFGDLEKAKKDDWVDQFNDYLLSFQAIDMVRDGLIAAEQAKTAFLQLSAMPLDTNLEEYKKQIVDQLNHVEPEVPVEPTGSETDIVTLSDEMDDDKLPEPDRPETVEELMVKIPLAKKYTRFYELFVWFTERPFAEYTYGPSEYVHQYSADTYPLEYKVKKLKQFIQNDYRILTQYVKIQKKVGVKYEFSGKDIYIKSYYRTTYEGSDVKLPTPMYAFPVMKPSPDVMLSARIYINGLLCPVTTYKRYEFADYVYVPEHYISENDYYELEVFPSLQEKHTIVFTAEKNSAHIKFESANKIIPTISDMFFYIESVDRKIPSDQFKISVVSNRYNAYTENPEEEISIYYPSKNGVAIHGNYWDITGKCFTFNGNRFENGDITAIEIGEKIANGEVIEEKSYKTTDRFEIIRDDEYKKWASVTMGETTIQPDNKKVIFSYVTDIEVTCLNSEIFDKPVTVAVAKSPAFAGQTAQITMFPAYVIPTQSVDEPEDYIQVYKNGRLLSRNRYEFLDIPYNADGSIKRRGVQILERVKAGESVAFVVSPYRNRLIYYCEDFEGEFIDLRGYINKPFDNSYYEVYLNGKRLTRDHVYPISPWEIKLARISSHHSLEIYEKDRDWEYYGLNWKRPTPPPVGSTPEEKPSKEPDDDYNVSDFIEEPFVKEDPPVRDEVIEEITKDPEPSEPLPEEPEEPFEKEMDLYSLYFQMFYYMDLVPRHFVDANENQFDRKKIGRASCRERV